MRKGEGFFKKLPLKHSQTPKVGLGQKKGVWPEKGEFGYKTRPAGSVTEGSDEAENS